MADFISLQICPTATFRVRGLMAERAQCPVGEAPSCAGTGPPCEMFLSEVSTSPQEVTYQKEMQAFFHIMSQELASIP